MSAKKRYTYVHTYSSTCQYVNIEIHARTTSSKKGLSDLPFYALGSLHTTYLRVLDMKDFISNSTLVFKLAIATLFLYFSFFPCLCHSSVYPSMFTLRA